MRPARTAIVTGAAKRVGAEIARALLAGGWTVLAHVRRETDAVEGANNVAADLSQLDCADRVFAAAQGLPPVRLLVNNAARFAFDGFGSFSAQEFDAHMAVNVRAAILLTERFAAGQDDGEDSLVVNILDSKLASPNPDFLSYTVSKQALAGITEVAARALAPKGIRVNGIAPSLMLRSEGQSEKNFASMHAANPLGRGVEPADVVAALRYLVDAPTVTGEVLTIDGGQRFWSPDRDVQFLERA
jgi:NAD(P)-dependent dehydrogenase (short-subunit alcohol dehydrogenase family)